MAINQKTIFVYDDFSTDQPVLMGSLYVNVIKGGESYSFEYDKGWLKKLLIQSSCRIPVDSIRPVRTFLVCLQMLLRTAGDACL